MGEDKNLLAKIFFVKIKEDDSQLSRHTVIYDVDSILFNKVDTVGLQ